MQSSRAALYGKGVFTTIAIYDGKPFLWEKHWRRLKDNADRLKIDISAFRDKQIEDSLVEGIEHDRIISGRARVTFHDERPSLIWPGESEGTTHLSIITGRTRPLPGNFKLTLSPFPLNSRSPLAGVKSCNYLENILALDEAKERGFDEAIRLNEDGHVTSGCMANGFWLKDKHLFTPSLSTGCLPGTTREFVTENLGCDEVEAGIDELNAADAIFLTSAGLGVVEIAEYGSRQFQKTDHPILDLLPKRR